ncbi:MAG TPA: glycosyltransferase, partial [Rubrivivax sp.]|nr:glycosyltransferase [Rubrivivax sp.]
MSTSVIVFAKAPVAGMAKTRLAPALGSARAAALAERMLRHALTQAAAADVGPVELCAAPDTTHPAL